MSGHDLIGCSSDPKKPEETKKTVPKKNNLGFKIAISLLIVFVLFILAFVGVGIGLRIKMDTFKEYFDLELSSAIEFLHEAPFVGIGEDERQIIQPYVEYKLKQYSSDGTKATIDKQDILETSNPQSQEEVINLLEKLHAAEKAAAEKWDRYYEAKKIAEFFGFDTGKAKP